MASTGAVQPKLFVLQYDFVADGVEKRKPHRADHLAYIGQQAAKGNVVLAGAVNDPPTGGILILRNLSLAEIEQLAKDDPYITNGVVENFTVKPYIAVVGDDLLKNDLLHI